MSESTPEPLGRIIEGDNLPILQSLPTETVQLVYTDPPFNTGNVRTYQRLRTTQDEHGDRTGFGGRTYRSERTSAHAYADAFEAYIDFLAPRLAEIWRLLQPDGTLYLHLDAREVHYVKVLLDNIFGRDCFLNEIIWAYDFGGRPKRRWPAQTRQHPRLRQRPRTVHLQPRRYRPHPLPRPRTRRQGESRTRQAPHRRLVAHHRRHQRQRTHRLPDPETHRPRQTHHPGLQQPPDS